MNVSSDATDAGSELHPPASGHLLQSLAEPAPPRATLQVFPEGGVWVGTTTIDAPHQHFTASIKVALGGCFRVRTASSGWLVTEALLTAPCVEQQLEAPGVLIANVLVDPESDGYGRLLPRLSASADGVCPIEPEVAQELRRDVLSVLEANAPYVAAWDAVVARLSLGLPEAKRRMDARVRRVAAVLKREFASPPKLSALASFVRLSEGRLTHLFTEQMGLSLRQYVLWLRVRDVVLSLAAGASLTKAAHDAGFSDSPHLSRTFRAMFGDPPSVLVPGRGHFDLRFDAETARCRPGPHADADRARAERFASLRGLSAA